MPTRINIIFGKGQIVAQPARADIYQGTNLEVNPIDLDQPTNPREVTISPKEDMPGWLAGSGKAAFDIPVPQPAGAIEQIFSYRVETDVGYLDPEVIIRK